MDNEHFNFKIPEYKPGTVIRLMQNYMSIRIRLLDRTRTNPDMLYITPREKTEKEVPLGSTSSQSWPFMERSISKGPLDGKKRAMMEEELHVAAIDLEEALKKLGDDDFDLAVKYFILQTHTLDELCKYMGLSSKGGLQERLQRIVKRIARHMNMPEQERDYVSS